MLWERYFEKLVLVARQQLLSGHRRVVDEEDVALGVFESLCNGATRGWLGPKRYRVAPSTR